MISVRRTLLSVCLLVVTTACLSSTSTEAFVTTPSRNSLTKQQQQQQQVNVPKSSSALQERKWNFNEGQAPWGLKKNAEIWNGRVAQVCCCWSSAMARHSPAFWPKNCRRDVVLWRRTETYRVVVIFGRATQFWARLFQIALHFF